MWLYNHFFPDLTLLEACLLVIKFKYKKTHIKMLPQIHGYVIHFQPIILQDSTIIASNCVPYPRFIAHSHCTSSPWKNYHGSQYYQALDMVVESMLPHVVSWLLVYSDPIKDYSTFACKILLRWPSILLKFGILTSFWMYTSAQIDLYSISLSKYT
jgi:hypothetical protein